MAKSKTKVLFLIHDLGHGGAEKVLVNLVNHLDRNKFDITVIALFGGGVNEQFLKPDIHYKAVFPKDFPGNSHVMKLFSPRLLHRLFVKEHYDIEVSYLEGPSARIISGCQHADTKLVSWIHCTMSSKKEIAASFRSEREAKACYDCFDQMVFVSDSVREAFLRYCPLSTKTCVLYNTNETDQILSLKDEPVEENVFSEGEIRLCGVGKLLPTKGFDRLARIHKRLRDEGYPVHSYVLGNGPEKEKLEAYLTEHHLENSFTLLGYQINPYKYVAKCDLFVCTSIAEGFSTAATEALIVGTPVCTTEVSGMREMLGENNEWGVVTENDDDALYRGIRRFLEAPEMLNDYRLRARQRGKTFRTEETVRAVETMFHAL
ncbi:MAG: glycosyltransferase [Candidatus Ventricola sp.]